MKKNTRIVAAVVLLAAISAGVSACREQLREVQTRMPASVPPAETDSVLFWSDFRTATGNSLNAVSDGGKWNIQSRGYDRTMKIVPSTGLDFPTRNVYQVIGLADMEGWSMLRKTGMPVPDVNESRYYRWYIRVTLPDYLSDHHTHPIQDGNAGSQANWSFNVINSNRGNITSVPAGQWNPQIWAVSAPYPNQRWYGPNLKKNETYRFEVRIRRATATHFSMSVRIFDSTGAPIANDSHFRNYDVGATLSADMVFPFKNPANLDGLNAGNNGIAGDDPPWPFTISYQGGFAVCGKSWCGPYSGKY